MSAQGLAATASPGPTTLKGREGERKGEENRVAKARQL